MNATQLRLVALWLACGTLASRSLNEILPRGIHNQRSAVSSCESATTADRRGSASAALGGHSADLDDAALAGGAEVVVDRGDGPDRAGSAHNETTSRQALQAVDRFMEAFNARDSRAWAGTLHFPHVRIADGQVRVWKSPDEYQAEWDFAALIRSGWHHSRYDQRRIVQQGRDKVHVAVKFTRYRADETPLASYEALYVVSRIDGRWGIQARSSFAP